MAGREKLPFTDPSTSSPFYAAVYKCREFAFRDIKSLSAADAELGRKIGCYGIQCALSLAFLPPARLLPFLFEDKENGY